MHTQTDPGATTDLLEVSNATAPTQKSRLERRRQELIAQGFNASEWARQHGFNINTVMGIMSGARKGNYGVGHRIAVMLGIKEGTLPADETQGQDAA